MKKKNSGKLAIAKSEIDASIELENSELADFEAAHLAIEEEPEAFLPEAGEDASEELPLQVKSELNASELAEYESAEIEDIEFVEDERLESIIESILFASDRPVSLHQIKSVFKGTNIKTDKIRRILDKMAVELAGAQRGITLEEAPGGYQLRTKIDNMQFLSRSIKARPFRVSGPALEVLAIVAYKQPMIKSEIDQIRGVESGHLLRALMERGLVTFEGKSDLPGKPMQYGTTRKFLEIFGLRNLKELPTLSQIDELLPEGMTEDESENKQSLGQLADGLAQSAGMSYSEGEEELAKITDQLSHITTSSDFFEQEKIRQRQKRDAEKAQNIRDAITFGEAVTNRDRNWLERYDQALAAGESAQFSSQEAKAAEVAVVAETVIAESSVDFEEAAEHAYDDDLAVDLHDNDSEGSEPNGEINA